mmetsp:Transcript_4570/g.6951  ORF Transcript_4570/g.6951 Transcript_4570/m.6951 type:complete len:226 (+) Transcript_4570:535-1212(+)
MAKVIPPPDSLIRGGDIHTPSTPTPKARESKSLGLSFTHKRRSSREGPSTDNIILCSPKEEKAQITDAADAAAAAAASVLSTAESSFSIVLEIDFGRISPSVLILGCLASHWATSCLNFSLMELFIRRLANPTGSLRVMVRAPAIAFDSGFTGFGLRMGWSAIVRDSSAKHKLRVSTHCLWIDADGRRMSYRKLGRCMDMVDFCPLSMRDPPRSTDIMGRNKSSP